jgi:hypothetical protein
MWLLVNPNVLIGTNTLHILEGSNRNDAADRYVYINHDGGIDGYNAKFSVRGYDPNITIEEFFDSLVELLYDISCNQIEITLTRRIDRYDRTHYIAHLSMPLTKAQYDRVNDVENPPPPF